jgi:putative ABC transport system permease protein
MTRVALKSMLGRRVRTALTALAIVLGVAMVAGAYTLTDTMGGAADSLSKASYEGTDAVVTARTAFEVEDDYELGAGPGIPASTLERVREAPGVERAVGSITDEARIVGRDGEVDGGGPYFGIGLDPSAGELSPFRLERGRFAAAAGEVVIDAGTADREGYAVGDRIRVQARGPARTTTITGIATFGDVDSIGTATFALFDVEAAQRLFDKQGRYDEVLVDGGGGAAVREALRSSLPSSVKVQSAEAHDRFTLDGLREFVSFIQVLLLVFGGIAVLVGAFTIFNTLSITVAQRSRELGLLRSLGAMRRQVLRSVVVEALAIGAIASAVGLGAGVLLAIGLSSVFASVGLDLPQADMVLAARTVVVSLLVGIVVTVGAGLGPALRATCVSPVTALRTSSAASRSRIGRLVRPLASVLGRPAERLAGAAGALARRNAMRNPGRTAATAAALTIGIALVAFSAVLGQGLRESTKGAISEQVRGDYAIVGHDGQSRIDPAAARAAAEVPGVEAATGIAQDRGRAFGEDLTVDGVDPARVAAVLGREWEEGSDAALSDLSAGGAVVTDELADEHSLAVGDRFAVTAPTGRRLDLRVAGISKPDRFNPLGVGDVTIARSAYDAAFAAERERYAFVKASGGAEVQAALERALRPYADVELQTKSEFEADQSAWVDQILALFYVLLALSVLVSLFGIVNMLALSVLERTRELGLLRAVGMSRRQVRRMVRHESVVTALIGAVLGIAVGLLLAALATTALSSEGLRFAVPVGALVTFTVIAALAGVLAAILPARRASRLNVLDALQHE